MTRLLHISAALSLMLCLALASCSDDSCYDNGSSLPLATLHLDGGKQQTITGLTITGIGTPGDSMLADSTSLSEVYLPLRASATTTSYRIRRWVATGDTGHALTDTLTLDYRPIEFFHSLECGAMFNFDIHQVSHTRHGIDSVVVLTPLVTNSRTPALRIYFTNSNS